MSEDEPRSSDQVESTEPLSCPNCEQPLVVVVSKGRYTHRGQPCGCLLTTGQVRSLR